MPPTESVTPSPQKDVVLTAACCSAIATLVPIALYQTGMLSGLPEPPAPIFDSERITSYKAAHPLGVPDALLGLASFGTTLTLILLAKRSPGARKLLGAKLSLDAAAGAFNAGRQVVSFGKLCSWCTGTAIAAGVMAYAGRNVIEESWRDATLAVRSAYKERD
ncbi:vitamin K epoxide reductase family protein [Terriglobus sp.]|uniref:vitamin K epoxide reductase family protein n=1 Tax=Terriglobus sp. TaxID=1889013 RepID=UPI003B004294